MRILLSAITWLAMVMPCDAATYSSQRLQAIAERVCLVVPATWPADTSFIAASKYNGRELRVNTNAYGDISHVGYRIFDEDILMGNNNASVMEFVERYLLELDLSLDHRTADQRMSLDKVTLTKGNVKLLKSISVKTPFSIKEMNRRMYEIEWGVDHCHVALNIPADCQLFLGENAIGLEKMLIRDIKRTTSHIPDIVPLNAKASRSDADVLIVDGGKYLSEAIRGDLYFMRLPGKKELVCNKNMVTRSVSNIMLTGSFKNTIPLKLKVDRYGYKVDTITISIQQFINYCKQENCKLYFGIKSTKDGILSGTLFALNEKMAYNHVLSVEFPVDIIKGKPVAANATLYCYIPLQNVTEKFFTQSLTNGYEYEN